MNVAWQFILADAERIRKAGSGKHTYSRDEYQHAMLDLAQSERRERESAAAALSRLWGSQDQRIEALYKASEAAPMIRTSAAPSSERSTAYALMDAEVISKKQADESYAQAFDRLLLSDSYTRALYDVYSRAAS